VAADRRRGGVGRRRPFRSSTRTRPTASSRSTPAVEAAYFAGFFEWPRGSSGEEVAESLDITSPTFHQHVRAAENKVFTALFDG
jgi:hypothetical protein